MTHGLRPNMNTMIDPTQTSKYYDFLSLALPHNHLQVDLMSFIIHSFIFLITYMVEREISVTCVCTLEHAMKNLFMKVRK